MEEAIRLAEEEGYRPKENWYVLLAACFSELKDKKIIVSVCSRAASRHL